MFRGTGLVIFGGALVFVSCVVIYLEWRAVSDIREGLARGGSVASVLSKGRHALLHRLVSEGTPEAIAHAVEKFAASAEGVKAKLSHMHGLRGSRQSGPEPAAGRRITDVEPAAEEEDEEVPAQFSGTFPPFPTPGEVRHPRCLNRDYDLESLPHVSLVIPYLHETWDQISFTVGSLLAQSPLEVIDQILFIDDGNDKEWQFHRQLRALHPKVKIHRNAERQGLIRSKVIGASLVESPVILFMEPHCIVVTQWLEPLLEHLATSGDHNMLVMPTLDIIPEKDNNKYLPANHHIGGFDWSLSFNWMNLIETRNASYVYPDPYPTPALSGGIFGIWKDSWEKMGTYDTQMSEWGGEHIEMSLRTWRCGGRIEIVPCSRMGHVFRAKNPYVVHVQEVLKNTKRAALVWLDEHIEEYYKKAPYAYSIDAGDVTERLKLKESLHCKSMDWYIENVYPELKGEQKPR
eukprot:TRINITY_DN78539_c0_g1_i1.p1 TRINITY_DN78539_c0_g1~~TRINITY_DN78539_c0_g1_i1.p1  ORF type:complete len:461 (-),score=83.27 TRINITY_DN78539_c0_g1_i1:75-1457(-)